MSGLVQEVEYAILQFVKSRIDERDWKDLTTPNDILRKLQDDDEEEIKEFCWNKIQEELRWSSILDEIHELVVQQEQEENEEEDIYVDSTQTEDEDDD